MDNTIEKKKVTKPSVKKSVITTKVETKIPVVKDDVIIEKDKPKVNKKISIPLDTMISCKSAVRGTLEYHSKRVMGYQVVWDDFGDEQFVELQELVSMRNTDLRFFKDNWVVIDDSDEYTANEILKFIRVDQYYKDLIDIDNFDSLFNEDPKIIKEKISKMSSGLKDTIGIRAKQLYNNGVLDSRSRIDALEESLGIELTVRSWFNGNSIFWYL